MTNWIRGSSTWIAASPQWVSKARTAMIAGLADLVLSWGSGRFVAAIDGRTASGKTTLADELAQGLAPTPLAVFRASLDDFKKPWRDRHLHDRESGDGYYRNAFDHDLIKSSLVGGFRIGETMLCSIDPITQLDHSRELVKVPEYAILIVDGVFALRPELREIWDLRVWVDVDPQTSDLRARARDGEMLERYRESERIYLSEERPHEVANIVVTNEDVANPSLIRTQSKASPPSAVRR